MKNFRFYIKDFVFHMKYFRFNRKDLGFYMKIFRFYTKSFMKEFIFFWKIFQI